MSQQNLKEQVKNISKDLSLKDASDIFYEIILQKKLEQAEEDVKNGKVHTSEEVEEKLKRWFN
jgi:hypothetical protein